MKTKRVYIPATVNLARESYEQALNYLGYTSVYLGKDNPNIFNASEEEIYKEVISLVASCDCYLKTSDEPLKRDGDPKNVRMEHSAFSLLDKDAYTETKLGDDILTKAVLDNEEKLEILALIRNVAEINEKADGHDIKVIEECSRLIKELIVFKRGAVSKMTVANRCYSVLGAITGLLMLQDSLNGDDMMSHFRYKCEQVIHNYKKSEAMPDIWS